MNTSQFKNNNCSVMYLFLMITTTITIVGQLSSLSLFCNAFSPLSRISHQTQFGNKYKNLQQFSQELPSSLSLSSIPFDQSEEDEIRELILSISLESDDVKRREKLTSVLEENLKQDGTNADSAAKFAYLWDINVIKIGGEIQDEARVEAEKKIQDEAEIEAEKKSEATIEAATSAEPIDTDATDTTDIDANDDQESSNNTIPKSDKEKQLWAMIDMMIQSKSLIKKISQGES